ncbi:hypothetical protein [Mesorhizobium sp.]|uniref:hypothetical protein n=1 Tax=Mesorhizobium sp. TaxID=1871066 RepID=UPI0025FBEE90|nr:hypothetical protein [Mesorhizobium sp.]
MLTEAFGFDGDDFPDRFASQFLSRHFQLLSDLSQHESRRSWISVKLRMNVGPQRVEHLPASVRSACEPVNRLRSLHDFEFLGAMGPKVVFNQRANAQIDDQQAARLNAGLSQSGECNTRSVTRWLPAQVHCWINTSRASKDMGKFSYRSTNGTLLRTFCKP